MALPIRSFPKMLAQRLLVDLELIGDCGLGDANGRSVLDERALFGSRLIFSGFIPPPAISPPSRQSAKPPNPVSTKSGEGQNVPLARFHTPKTPSRHAA
jgi:hypothetical protein